MDVDLVTDSHENSLDSSHACSEENGNISVQNESSDQENRVATGDIIHINNNFISQKVK